ncbi:hypothetical protein K3495_g7156 [Podosphaera aphanis]|nr:hypothetical protein K3495_g7156 [Podosphaera aphanis]
MFNLGNFVRSISGEDGGFTPSLISASQDYDADGAGAGAGEIDDNC